MADLGYAEEVAAEFVSGLADAGTTTALVFGAHFAPAVDALFRAASERGLRITSGLVVSDRLLRPELPHHRRAGVRPGVGAGEALARRGARALCGDPAVRAVVQRRAAGVLRGAARGGPRQLADVACQREPSRDRHRRGPVRMQLRRELSPSRSDRAPDRARAQRPPDRRGAGVPGKLGRGRRPLPHEQCVAGQRDVPARPPPRPPRAGGARHRRRRRHRVLDVQGGVAGVLHAAAARLARGAADRGPPAAPGHRGGCGRARARRSDRRPLRRQAVRRAVAAPAGRQSARRRAAPRSRPGAGARSGVRARRAARTWRGSGSRA